MFFLIKLLKSCKKYHRKKKYLPVVKLLNLRRPLGEKSLGLGYPSPVQEEVVETKSEEFDLKSKLTTEFDLNLQ